MPARGNGGRPARTRTAHTGNERGDVAPGRHRPGWSRQRERLHANKPTTHVKQKPLEDTGCPACAEVTTTCPATTCDPAIEGTLRSSTNRPSSEPGEGETLRLQSQSPSPRDVAGSAGAHTAPDHTAPHVWKLPREIVNVLTTSQVPCVRVVTT